MSKLTHRNIPKGLETGDPEGLIPAAEQAQVKLDSERRGGKKIALGVGAVILTGVTALGIGKVAGGNEATPTNTEPTATASATPSETVTAEPVVDPLEKYNIPESIEPVTVEKYPTVEKAVDQLLYLRNQMMLYPSNPTVEALFIPVLLGPLDEVQYGEGTKGAVWEHANDAQRSFQQINESLGYYHEENPEDTNVPEVFSYEVHIDTILGVNGNTVTYTSRVTDSNFDKIPAHFQDENLPATGEVSQPQVMELEQVDGKWLIVSTRAK